MGIFIIGKTVSNYKILEKLGGQLQNKKKASACSDREGWLQHSRSVRATVSRAECITQIRTLLPSL